MTLVKELLDLPDQIRKGDFVLELGEDQHLGHGSSLGRMVRGRNYAR